jgi:Skp family chaperone for outer membrane proteins
LKHATKGSKKQIPEYVWKNLPREVQEYLQRLEHELKEKEEELKEKNKKVENLKELLRVSEGHNKQNSTNSSKPPSSDGLQKKPTISGSMWLWV